MGNPTNATLKTLLKHPPQLLPQTPTSTSDQVPGVSSASRIDFSEVHLESPVVTPTPSSIKHEKRERELGREKSLLLKKYGKLDLQLEQAKKSLQTARSANDEERKEKIKGELQSLKKQKSRIKEKIDKLGSNEDSVVSSSDTDEDISSPYKSPQVRADEIREKIEKLQSEVQFEISAGNEKKAERLRGDIDELNAELARIAPRRSRNETPPPLPRPAESSKTLPGSEATSDDLIKALTASRTERLKALHEYQNDLSDMKRDNAPEDDIRTCMKEIATLKTEIGVLENLISQISSTPPDPTSNLAQTLTRHGRRPTHPPAPEGEPSSSGTKAQNADKRRSSFLLSDDLKELFSNEGLKELDRIESEIEELLKRFENLHADMKKWEKEAEEATHSHDREDFEYLSQNFRKAYDATTLKIAKLIDERSKLETIVFPGVSRADRDTRREKFLDQFKSQKTRDLEARYKKKLAKLEHKVRAECGSTAMYYVAGLSAFGASFFIGNALSRIRYAGSAHTGAFIAALLHVTVAGPVLKQLLAKSWSAPSFVEFNNRVKLAGAKLGDVARGETLVKKYDSKDPKHVGQLTIDERIAEERAFGEILRDRFETEDAPYFFYVLNYLGKAAMAAGMASFMASGGWAAILTELALHSVLGAMSGAETVAGIQHQRSRHPKAELKAVPTRKIYAAEADAKASLLTDLTDALSKWQARQDKSPSDTTGPELMKEIRRTTKALETARTKSQLLGTFGNEFVSQFKPGDPLADTASEVLGRWASVVPSAVLSGYLSGARASGDPLLVFLGHALPAVLLISPPGFAARAVYIAAFRSIIQAMINGSAGHLAAQAPGAEDEGGRFAGNPNEHDEQRQDWM